MMVVLAIMVLLLFLRSWRSTLVIGLAIPISAVGTFLILTLLGRTLNVVSLAGIAFAIGMVVDSAIVVLENIYSKTIVFALNGIRPYLFFFGTFILLVLTIMWFGASQPQVNQGQCRVR